MEFGYEKFVEYVEIISNPEIVEIEEANDSILSLRSENIHMFFSYLIRLLRSGVINEKMNNLLIIMIKDTFDITHYASLDAIRRDWFSYEFSEIKTSIKEVLLLSLLSSSSIQCLAAAAIANLLVIEEHQWNTVFFDLLNMNTNNENSVTFGIIQTLVEIFRTNALSPKIKPHEMPNGILQCYELIYEVISHNIADLLMVAIEAYYLFVQRLPFFFLDDINRVIDVLNSFMILLPNANIEIYSKIHDIIYELSIGFYSRSDEFFEHIYTIAYNGLFCSYWEFLIISIKFWKRIAKYEYKQVILNVPSFYEQNNLLVPSNLPLSDRNNSRFKYQQLVIKSINTIIDPIYESFLLFESSLQNTKDTIIPSISLASSKALGWIFSLWSSTDLLEHMIGYFENNIGIDSINCITSALFSIRSLFLVNRYNIIEPYVLKIVPILFDFMKSNNPSITIVSMIVMKPMIKRYSSVIIRISTFLGEFLDIAEKFGRLSHDNPSTWMVVFHYSIELMGKILLKSRVVLFKNPSIYESYLDYISRMISLHESSTETIKSLFNALSYLFSVSNENYWNDIKIFYIDQLNQAMNLMITFDSDLVQKIPSILNLGTRIVGATKQIWNRDDIDGASNIIFQILNKEDVEIYCEAMLLFSAMILQFRELFIPNATTLINRIQHAMYSQNPQLIGIASMTFGDLVQYTGDCIFDEIIEPVNYLMNLLESSNEEMLSFYHHNLITAVSSCICGLKNNFLNDIYNRFMNHIGILFEYKVDIITSKKAEYRKKISYDALMALNWITKRVDSIILEENGYIEWIKKYLKTFLINLSSQINFGNSLLKLIDDGILFSIVTLAKELGIIFGSKGKINVFINNRYVSKFIDLAKASQRLDLREEAKIAENIIKKC